MRSLLADQMAPARAEAGAVALRGAVRAEGSGAGPCRSHIAFTFTSPEQCDEPLHLRSRGNSFDGA